jgi:hypothetical protein
MLLILLVMCLIQFNQQLKYSVRVGRIRQYVIFGYVRDRFCVQSVKPVAMKAGKHGSPLLHRQNRTPHHPLLCNLIPELS